MKKTLLTLALFTTFLFSLSFGSAYYIDGFFTEKFGSFQNNVYQLNQIEKPISHINFEQSSYTPKCANCKVFHKSVNILHKEPEVKHIQGYYKPACKHCKDFSKKLHLKALPAEVQFKQNDYTTSCVKCKNPRFVKKLFLVFD